MDEQQLLTVPEAAGILRLGRTRVYELVRTNVLPVVRLGKTIRIPKAALLKFIDDNTQLPNNN